jgi:hypothetical protein
MCQIHYLLVNGAQINLLMNNGFPDVMKQFNWYIYASNGMQIISIHRKPFSPT